MALVLIGWWLASRQMPAFVLPSPSDVGRAMLSLFLDPSFNAHMVASVGRLVLPRSSKESPGA